ncbi:M35 family metallo-endopeptidase [Polyangium sorediatum]|uniref:M35 family metallo-endopeptidase n=1 Tax=Polyangium sorediatum TaxID=889274 RepID=A0ABT6P665_9BACT|nr:M35 family metallo-endopeptidase [Polyangium sorediatum]MDI1436116.1 M35 family metallo-endopeptidase [Polyangium sorediatum]
MSKDDDVRINETMKQIMVLFPAEGRGLKDAIQNALMTQFAAGPARASLSKALSIGGLHFGGAQRRHVERIYLLAERVVGKKTDVQMATCKQIADSLTEVQLRGLVVGLAQAVAATPPAGTVQIAESFNYGPADAARRAEAAVTKAKRILGDMYQGINAAKADAKERARFEKWFGPMEATRYDAVRRNVEMMFRDVTTRPLKLYYRGAGVSNKLDDQPGSNYHNIHVKLREDPNNYGCFIPGWPNGGAERDRTHILLGGAFFTSCQDVSHPTDVTKMSGAGVIVHELSHAVCATNDEKNASGQVLYGPRKCLAVAVEAPAKAVTNADSYRLFSDEYDSASV